MSLHEPTLLVAALFATAALALLVAAGLANAVPSWADARVGLLLAGAAVGTGAMLALATAVVDLHAGTPSSTPAVLLAIGAATVPLSVVTGVLTVLGRRTGRP